MVRQIRNDFFKLTFLQKNERTNSTLLLVDLFLFGFLEESEDNKKTFRNYLTFKPYESLSLVQIQMGTGSPKRLKLIKELQSAASDILQAK
jgi:hypothetical protein